MLLCGHCVELPAASSEEEGSQSRGSLATLHISSSKRCLAGTCTC